MRYKLTFVTGLALGYVIGTRAGREQYEKLKKSAKDISQNPAVRNAAESAAQTGRQVAGKAAHVVGDKVATTCRPPWPTRSTRCASAARATGRSRARSGAPATPEAPRAAESLSWG